MKFLKRGFSVVLAIALMLSMFAFVTSAAAAKETAVIDLDMEQTNSDPAVYKITVSVTCPKPAGALGFRIYYDRETWKVINKNGTPNSSANNAAYNKLGQFLDTRSYEIEVATEIEEQHRGDFTEEYVSGVGTGSFTYNVTNVNTNQYGTLDPQKYNCVLFSYQANIDDESLMFDCRTKQPVFSFYMQALEGADLSSPDAAIGQFEGGQEWVVAYSVDGSMSTLFTGGQDQAIPVIHNAVVSTGPKVEYKGGQYKMTATSAEAVADEFQFRVISKISDADWNTYLANTGSSEDNNCVTKLGFVAYKGAEGFDMDQAKAAAKAGETQGNYYVATTNYIKHTDGSDAEFAARIDTTKTTCDDATCIAFVQYKDADGTEQYAFYDAEYKAQLKTNYDSLVQKYLATNPFKG